MGAIAGLLSPPALLVFGIVIAGIAVQRRAAAWARVGGFAFLSLVALVSLVFAIGEMAEGVPGGAGHLVPSGMALALMILARLRETWAGMIALALGVTVALFFLTAMQGAWQSRALASLLAGVPFLVSGCLFLVANAVERSGAGSSTTAGRSPA